VARAAARGPLLEAARIARELGARPLLRELTNLASRALINLPGAEPERASDRGTTERATDHGHAVGAPSQSDLSRGKPTMAGRTAASAGEPISSRLAPEPEPALASAGPGSRESGIAAAFAPEDGGSRQKEAFGLSRREREVLALIAEGRTNREIGERLFISQKTVGVHVGNILAKLGASGRVEAAMVAIRLELVATPLATRPVLAPT
jgi:DNA-binding CsgD family transcriptional regulator